MTDKPEKPAAASAEPAAKPTPPAEKQAVLTEMLGDLVPGRIVRGPVAEVSALITSGKARAATPADVSIAGGRTVRLPKQQRR